MAGRNDGLPHPVTTGEAFQAAILEELRGLRADIKKLKPEPTNESEDGVSHIREKKSDKPERKK